MGHVDQVAKKLIRCVALGIGTISSVALGPSTVASANCFSAFGIGNGGGCTSNITSIAIGVGAQATATSDGWFSSAVAVGPSAQALVYSGGAFDFSVAAGKQAQSLTAGIVSLGAAVGDFTVVNAGLGPGGFANIAIDALGSYAGGAVAGGVGNIALDLAGKGTSVQASGRGNAATNLFGNGNTLIALGDFNNAVNVFGNNSAVFAKGTGMANATLSWAVNAFAGSNKVFAGPGPAAIAGAVLTSGLTVTKSGPGINVNGAVVIGGASAVQPAPSAGSRPRQLGHHQAGPTTGSQTKSQVHARSGRR